MVNDHLCASCGQAAAAKFRGLCIFCTGNRLALAEARMATLEAMLQASHRQTESLKRLVCDLTPPDITAREIDALFKALVDAPQGGGAG